MATTVILTPGTTTAYSSDITVVAGTPVTIGAFVEGDANASYALDRDVSLVIEKETEPGENFVDTGFRLQGFVNDVGSGPNVTLTGAGIYRVRRIAGQLGGQTVGVNKD